MEENLEINWKDYYRILQVHSSAEPEVIAGAYNKLLHKYHPDHNPGKEQWANEKTKEIIEAYEILSNPDKRKVYHSDYLQRMKRSNNAPPSPPLKPRPEVNPTIIRFQDVIPGETRKSNFIVKNSGGPYSKVWISNPNSWLNIVNQKPLYDGEKLPLFVEIKVEGGDWGETYVDNVIIKLDDIETHVRVELTTRPKPLSSLATTPPEQSQNDFKNNISDKGRESIKNIIPVKAIGKILVLIGLLGLIIGAGFYFFKTETVKVNGAPLVIEKASFFTSETHYYQQEQVIPTTVAKPDMKYLLVLDFSLFKLENNVTWNQLQIGIEDEKTVTNQISQDEYTALTQNPNYNLTIYEVKPERNIVDIIPGILVLLLGSVLFLRSKDNKDSKDSKDSFSFAGNNEALSEQSSTTTEDINNEKVSAALNAALRAMDTTHKWYTNEEEANRELVSSLKAMGHNAVYHQYLGDGRTADAFFEGSIVEAKLDPSQSEVDRLEGQIVEYLKYPYAVRVVLYGQVDYQLLLRIKEIVSRRPERIFLTYLPNAKRVRKSNYL
jgi:hypothetical protein